MARTFTITSYGKTKEYPESQRKKMIKEFETAMLCCDGSEAERYRNIYCDLVPVRRSVWTQNVHWILSLKQWLSECLLLKSNILQLQIFMLHTCFWYAQSSEVISFSTFPDKQSPPCHQEQVFHQPVHLSREVCNQMKWNSPYHSFPPANGGKDVFSDNRQMNHKPLV